MTDDLIKKFEEQSDALISKAISTKPSTNGTIDSAIKHYTWFGDSLQILNGDLKKQITDLTSDGGLIEQMQLIAADKVNNFIAKHK